MALNALIPACTKQTAYDSIHQPRHCSRTPFRYVNTGCTREFKKARFLEHADRYFQAGQYEKAKIEYLNALRIEPSNALAIKRMGLIWYEQGAPLKRCHSLTKREN